MRRGHREYHRERNKEKKKKNTRIKNLSKTPTLDVQAI